MSALCSPSPRSRDVQRIISVTVTGATLVFRIGPPDGQRRGETTGALRPEKVSPVNYFAGASDAWNRYCHVADDVNAETFAQWSSDDLRTLRVLLERVARDVSKGSPTLQRQSKAS